MGTCRGRFITKRPRRGLSAATWLRCLAEPICAQGKTRCCTDANCVTALDACASTPCVPPAPVGRAGQLSGAHCAEKHTRRVLILYPDSNLNRSALVVGEAIRKRIAGALGTPNIKTHGEFLDLSQFSDDAHRQRVVRYPGRKVRSHSRSMSWWRLARTASRRSPAIASLLVSQRSDRVLLRVASATLATIDLPARCGGHSSASSTFASTVSLAERLQPDARHLVVIAGRCTVRPAMGADCPQINSPSRRSGSRRATWSVLPRDALLAEVANLSRDTIVVVPHDLPGRDRQGLPARRHRRRRSANASKCAGLQPLRYASSAAERWGIHDLLRGGRHRDGRSPCSISWAASTPSVTARRA